MRDRDRRRAVGKLEAEPDAARGRPRRRASRRSAAASTGSAGTSTPGRRRSADVGAKLGERRSRASASRCRAAIETSKSVEPRRARERPRRAPRPDLRGSRPPAPAEPAPSRRRAGARAGRGPRAMLRRPDGAPFGRRAPRLRLARRRGERAPRSLRGQRHATSTLAVGQSADDHRRRRRRLQAHARRARPRPRRRLGACGDALPAPAGCGPGHASVHLAEGLRVFVSGRHRRRAAHRRQRRRRPVDGRRSASRSTSRSATRPAGSASRASTAAASPSATSAAEGSRAPPSSAEGRRSSQCSFCSTFRSPPTSSSICASEMISGGDIAMMSPVVRIRMPALVGVEERLERPPRRLPGDRLELDRADHPLVADVDDVRAVPQRMQRLLPDRRERRGPLEQPLLGIGLERREPRRAAIGFAE